MIFGFVMGSAVYIIFTILIYFANKNEEEDLRIKDPSKDTDLYVWRLVSTAFAIILTMFISSSSLPTVWVKEASKEIYSVGNGSEINGHFVLGSGVINEKMYYYYYEDGEMGIKISKIESSKVEIIEYDNDSYVPQLITYKEKNKKNDIFFGFGTDRPFAKSKYILFVPQGTIKIQWNISLGDI